MAVETRGIRHVHLLVSDHGRSKTFYETVFGMTVGFREGNILFLRSPNRSDDLALHLPHLFPQLEQGADDLAAGHFRLDRDHAGQDGRGPTVTVGLDQLGGEVLARAAEQGQRRMVLQAQHHNAPIHLTRDQDRSVEKSGEGEQPV